MKKNLIKVFLFSVLLIAFTEVATAQKKNSPTRSSTKRSNTTVRKNTKGKTKANVSPGAQVDSVVTAAVVAPAPAKTNESLAESS
jgi:hypothetical protein